jgi:hypothetical protein
LKEKITPLLLGQKGFQERITLLTAAQNEAIAISFWESEEDAGWIPLYTLTRQETRHRWNSTPSRHNRLDQVVDTESDANRFALQVAMRWIDDASELQG